MRQQLLYVGAALLAFSTYPASAQDAAGCAQDARCISVNREGVPQRDGTHVAQCRGQFPDFIAERDRLSGWNGPFFRLSQDYPASDPGTDAPWLSIDFRADAGADDYLFVLRDYAFDGMIEVDFKPEDSDGRHWYHMPMMNFGPNPREFIHGLTEERPLFGPELGLKRGVRIRNFAIGFYNAAAATVLSKVWATSEPDLRDIKFPAGSMAFKILFSTAQGSDFADGTDRLAGAPSWTIFENGQSIELRLMQMDVAAAEPDIETGWVFGTLAYDRLAPDDSPWNRMRPVGLSWGNDEGVTPSDVQSGTPLEETIVSHLAPPYALGHLGWAGRMNGPVDNPASGCLSCHSTAQFPSAPMLPGANCDTDEKKLHWFRNVPGSVAFGAIDRDTCEPATPPGDRPLAPLDYSLQLAVAVQSVLTYRDVNPCGEDGPGADILAAPMETLPAARDAPSDAERIRR